MEKKTKRHEDGPSNVLTQKTVVDETFIQNSSHNFKSIVGINASQLYPFSIFHDVPTGLFTRWKFDTDKQKLKSRHNRSRNFENMVITFYQETRPECKIECFSHLVNRKKSTVLMLMFTVITVK